jgi:hypothetical protein
MWRAFNHRANGLDENTIMEILMPNIKADASRTHDVQ